MCGCVCVCVCDVSLSYILGVCLGQSEDSLSDPAALSDMHFVTKVKGCSCPRELVFSFSTILALIPPDCAMENSVMHRALTSS